MKPTDLKQEIQSNQCRRELCTALRPSLTPKRFRVPRSVRELVDTIDCQESYAEALVVGCMHLTT